MLWFRSYTSVTVLLLSRWYRYTPCHACNSLPHVTPVPVYPCHTCCSGTVLPLSCLYQWYLYTPCHACCSVTVTPKCHTCTRDTFHPCHACMLSHNSSYLFIWVSVSARCSFIPIRHCIRGLHTSYRCRSNIWRLMTPSSSTSHWSRRRWL